MLQRPSLSSFSKLFQCATVHATKTKFVILLLVFLVCHCTCYKDQVCHPSPSFSSVPLYMLQRPSLSSFSKLFQCATVHATKTKFVILLLVFLVCHCTCYKDQVCHPPPSFSSVPLYMLQSPSLSSSKLFQCAVVHATKTKFVILLQAFLVCHCTCYKDQVCDSSPSFSSVPLYMLQRPSLSSFSKLFQCAFVHATKTKFVILLQAFLVCLCTCYKDQVCHPSLSFSSVPLYMLQRPSLSSFSKLFQCATVHATKTKFVILLQAFLVCHCTCYKNQVCHPSPSFSSVPLYMLQRPSLPSFSKLFQCATVHATKTKFVILLQAFLVCHCTCYKDQVCHPSPSFSSVPLYMLQRPSLSSFSKLFQCATVHATKTKFVILLQAFLVCHCTCYKDQVCHPSPSFSSAPLYMLQRPSLSSFSKLFQCATVHATKSKFVILLQAFLVCHCTCYKDQVCHPSLSFSSVPLYMLQKPSLSSFSQFFQCATVHATKTKFAILLQAFLVCHCTCYKDQVCHPSPSFSSVPLYMLQRPSLTSFSKLFQCATVHATKTKFVILLQAFLVCHCTCYKDQVCHPSPSFSSVPLYMLQRPSLSSFSKLFQCATVHATKTKFVILLQAFLVCHCTCYKDQVCHPSPSFSSSSQMLFPRLYYSSHISIQFFILLKMLS